MTLYIQVSESGYITDCIEYEHEGYLEVELDLPLPERFIAYCYKYLGGNKYELDESKLVAQETKTLEQLQADLLYLSIMTGVEL